MTHVKVPPCHCHGYPFPHREFSGKCLANESGPFCGDCGLPCKAVEHDNGIGAYEYWGYKGVDVQIEHLSDCCSATCFDDAELKREYEPEDDFDPPCNYGD